MFARRIFPRCSIALDIDECKLELKVDEVRLELHIFSGYAESIFSSFRMSKWIRLKNQKNRNNWIKVQKAADHIEFDSGVTWKFVQHNSDSEPPINSGLDSNFYEALQGIICSDSQNRCESAHSQSFVMRKTPVCFLIFRVRTHKWIMKNFWTWWISGFHYIKLFGGSLLF